MSTDQKAVNRRGYAVGLRVVHSEASLKNALQSPASLSLDVRRRETRYGHPQNCQLSSSGCDVIERCITVAFSDNYTCRAHARSLTVEFTLYAMCALACFNAAAVGCLWTFIAAGCKNNNPLNIVFYRKYDVSNDL